MGDIKQPEHKPMDHPMEYWQTGDQGPKHQLEQHHLEYQAEYQPQHKHQIMNILEIQGKIVDVRSQGFISKCNDNRTINKLQNDYTTSWRPKVALEVDIMTDEATTSTVFCCSRNNTVTEKNSG